MLPIAFVKRMKLSLGEQEYLMFESALHTPPPVSVRLHPRKYSETLSFASDVPWCENGKYLYERPVFTLDPAFHSGSYYVQEASSMSLHYILGKIALNREELCILDLCGAPGGKSTLIADWLNGQGILVSNEVIRSRSQILKQNLIKSGYENIIVTNNDPADWSNGTGLFDIIVVDAPCSGEGLFRKDKNAIGEWSEENVNHCSLRQRRIIHDIIPALKEDGYLIYSTCTYNDSENISNVASFCEKYGMESVHMELENFDGVIIIEKNGIAGYQFFPHKVIGEGFFVSVLKKKQKGENPNKHAERYFTLLNKKEREVINSWLAQDNSFVLGKDKTGTIHYMHENLHNFTFSIPDGIRIINTGISIGQLNKDIFIPDHHLALSFIRNSHTVFCELSKSDALKYLKKELSEIPSDTKGWVLLNYKGQTLGWCKNLGNRINNYLPNEWRIRMDIGDKSDQERT